MKNPPRRWLRLTSPNMSGHDVTALQHAVRERQERRGVSRAHRVVVDGQYGPETARAVRAALWHLGCPADKLDSGATIRHQRWIRSPRRRPPWWLPIARDRKAYAERQDRGGRAFLGDLRGYIGKFEMPRDWNRGAWLDPLLRAVGFLPAGSAKGPPYCAIGLIALLRRAGLVSTPSSWAYTPAWLIAARNGVDGWHVVPTVQRQPGDVVFLKFPGTSRDLCDHVAAIEDTDHTIEFNTSPGTTGSQNNGGGCYRRDWAERAPFVVAVARPPWNRAK